MTKVAKQQDVDGFVARVASVLVLLGREKDAQILHILRDAYNEIQFIRSGGPGDYPDQDTQGVLPLDKKAQPESSPKK